MVGKFNPIDTRPSTHEAPARKIFEGLKTHAMVYGPSICRDADRTVVIWPARDKNVCMEEDLVRNYDLLREVLLEFLTFGEILPQADYQARGKFIACMGDPNL